MNERLYKVIDYNDLDKLVSKTYGREYEVVAAQECNNDTCLSYYADEEKFDKWDMAALRDWISGDNDDAPSLHVLLNDMVNNSILEAGWYLIQISW